MPAKISMLRVGMFFNFPPKAKPKPEFIMVMPVINKAGFKILFPDNSKEIPAENASILVAIPINSRQVIPIQLGLFFSSKASFINLKPKNTNKLGIRGVSKDNKYNRYVVDFTYKKDRFYLKPFENLEEAVYCRYLLESKINPIYRYKENDDKLFYYINQLSCSQKYEIEQYVNLKILEKGIYNET
jgi:hypothetical protein